MGRGLTVAKSGRGCRSGCSCRGRCWRGCRRSVVHCPLMHDPDYPRRPCRCRQSGRDAIRLQHCTAAGPYAQVDSDDCARGSRRACARARWPAISLNRPQRHGGREKSSRNRQPLDPRRVVGVRDTQSQMTGLRMLLPAMTPVLLIALASPALRSTWPPRQGTVNSRADRAVANHGSNR